MGVGDVGVGEASKGVGEGVGTGGAFSEPSKLKHIASETSAKIKIGIRNFLKFWTSLFFSSFFYPVIEPESSPTIHSVIYSRIRSLLLSPEF